MGKSTLILFALALVVCSGCTTVHDYYGSAANLKGGGECLPAGTHLKISVTCSGGAPSGDRYVALRVRGEDCWLILFHPPIDTASSWRADTAGGVVGAWLIRGRRPDCTALARSGRGAGFLTDRGERLHGSIEVLWRGDDDLTCQSSWLARPARPQCMDSSGLTLRSGSHWLAQLC